MLSYTYIIERLNLEGKLSSLIQYTYIIGMLNLEGTLSSLILIS